VSLCTVQFRGHALPKNTTMQVLVPEGRGPFPLLLLLHGLSADYSVWVRRHQAERLFEGKRVLVVMPDAGRSFYVNDPRPGGLRYHDHMIEDVLGYIERVFPVHQERRARGLIGISMGGYGALLLALRHPELFGVVASISGSTYFGHQPSERHRNDDVGALAASLPREGNDLFYLAERIANSTIRPIIRLSCGTQDHLWETNLAFHRHLARLGIPHTWVAHPGRHNDDTWDVQLPQAIDFVLGHLLGDAAPDPT